MQNKQHKAAEARSCSSISDITQPELNLLAPPAAEDVTRGARSEWAHRPPRLLFSISLQEI